MVIGDPMTDPIKEQAEKEAKKIAHKILYNYLFDAKQVSEEMSGEVARYIFYPIEKHLREKASLESQLAEAKAQIAAKPNWIKEQLTQERQLSDELADALKLFTIYKHYGHMIDEKCTNLCEDVDVAKEVFAKYKKRRGES